MRNTPLEMKTLKQINNNVDLVDQQLNSQIKVVSSLNPNQYLKIITQQLLEFKNEEFNDSEVQKLDFAVVKKT